MTRTLWLKSAAVITCLHAVVYADSWIAPSPIVAVSANGRRCAISAHLDAGRGETETTIKLLRSAPTEGFQLKVLEEAISPSNGHMLFEVQHRPPVGLQVSNAGIVVAVDVYGGNLLHAGSAISAFGPDGRVLWRHGLKALLGEGGVERYELHGSHLAWYDTSWIDDARSVVAVETRPDLRGEREVYLVDLQSGELEPATPTEVLRYLTGFGGHVTRAVLNYVEANEVVHARRAMAAISKDPGAEAAIRIKAALTLNALGDNSASDVVETLAMSEARTIDAIAGRREAIVAVAKFDNIDSVRVVENAMSSSCMYMHECAELIRSSPREYRELLEQKLSGPRLCDVHLALSSLASVWNADEVDVEKIRDVLRRPMIRDNRWQVIDAVFLLAKAGPRASKSMDDIQVIIDDRTSRLESLDSGGTAEEREIASELRQELRLLIHALDAIRGPGK